jgi:hypothetical protein
MLAILLADSDTSDNSGDDENPEDHKEKVQLGSLLSSSGASYFSTLVASIFRLVPKKVIL